MRRSNLQFSIFWVTWILRNSKTKRFCVVIYGYSKEVVVYLEGKKIVVWQKCVAISNRNLTNHNLHCTNNHHCAFINGLYCLTMFQTLFKDEARVRSILKTTLRTDNSEEVLSKFWCLQERIQNLSGHHFIILKIRGFFPNENNCSSANQVICLLKRCIYINFFPRAQSTKFQRLVIFANHTFLLRLS